MELQTFTGKPEALFFDPFDSVDAVEKAGAVLGPLYKEHPELVRMQAGINGALSSQRTILAVPCDSPGVNEINLAQARFLRMLVVRTRSGGEPPKLETAAAPAMMCQVNSGMPGPVFLIFQPLAASSHIAPPHVTAGTIVEDSVYVIKSEMSHVSRAFGEQDPTFWMKPIGQ
jgi:hypothetical protein